VYSVRGLLVPLLGAGRGPGFDALKRILKGCHVPLEAQHVVLHLRLQRVHLTAQPMYLGLGVLVIELEVPNVTLHLAENFKDEIFGGFSHALV
jgi:hypothetical protein